MSKKNSSEPNGQPVAFPTVNTSEVAARLDTLAAQNKELIDENEGLRTQAVLLDEQIRTVEAENKRLQESNLTAEQRATNLSQQNEAMKAAFHEGTKPFEKEIASLKTELESAKAELFKLRAFQAQITGA